MNLANRVLVILWLTAIGAFAQGRYTDAMYQRALADQGTSPLFVLISIKDERNKDRVVCVAAPLLLGAITHENKLGYDETGVHKQMEIAMKQPGRLFVFREARALNNIAPSYTPKVLAEVRKALGPASNADLIAQVADKNSALNNLYRPKKTPAEYDAYRDAAAQVLLEKGILVGRADITRELFVAK